MSLLVLLSFIQASFTPSAFAAVTNHLGAILAKPNIYNLYWDPTWEELDTNVPRARTDAATLSLINFNYFQCAAQYGVSNATFRGSQVSSPFCLNNLPFKRPHDTQININSRGIMGWALCEVGFPFWGAPAITGVPQPDDGSVYPIYLPTNVAIDDSPFGQSCKGWSAYHFASWVPKWKIFGIIPYLDPAQRFAYTVIPSICGDHVGDPNKNFDDVMFNSSHEIIEAATDVFPLPTQISDYLLPNIPGFFGLPGADLTPAWFDDSRGSFHGEVADLCDSIDSRLPDRTKVNTYHSNSDNGCCPFLSFNKTVQLTVSGLSPALLPAAATYVDAGGTSRKVELPFTAKAVLNTSVSYDYPSPICGKNGLSCSSGDKSRWVLPKGSSGTGTLFVTADLSHDEAYSEQFFLSVTTNPPAIQPNAVGLTESGWHDAGNRFVVNPSGPVAQGGKCWVFKSWSGDASGNQGFWLTMDKPKTFVAKYVEAEDFSACVIPPVSKLGKVYRYPLPIRVDCPACAKFNTRGDILVADSRLGVISEYDGAGRLNWRVGGGNTAAPMEPLTDARFAERREESTLVTLPDRILEIDATGTVTFKHELKTKLAGEHALLVSAAQARHVGTNQLLIADRGSHRVYLLDRSTGDILWLHGQAGIRGSDYNLLDAPGSAEKLPGSGNVLIADTGNHRVIEVGENHQIVRKWTANGRLREPASATRLENGNIFVVDKKSNQALELDDYDRVLWRYEPSGLISHATRLHDGHTLILGSGDESAIVVNGAGQVVAKLQEIPKSSGIATVVAAGKSSPTYETTAKACSAFANSYCKRMFACAGAGAGSILDTPARCTIDIKDQCLRNGAGFMDLALIKRDAPRCESEITSQKCDNIVLGRLPKSCFSIMGAHAPIGGACTNGMGCASGFCRTDGKDGCGTCQAAPKEGDHCSFAESTFKDSCGRGLFCTGKSVCAEFRTLGAACNPNTPCVPSLSCVGFGTKSAGVCKRQLAAGAACAIGEGAPASCDVATGLICDPFKKKCVHPKLSPAGGICGRVDGVMTLCKGTASCVSEPDRQIAHCMAALPVGSACNPKGPACRFPAVCSDGICELPLQGAACKAVIQ